MKKKCSVWFEYGIERGALMKNEARNEGKDIEVDIPKGTQFGDVLKMQGCGMPRLGKKGFGDLRVNVRIEVPKKPTPRQKELLEELAKETGGKKSFFEKRFEK